MRTVSQVTRAVPAIPVWPATIHQSHCTPLAHATGAHPEASDHPVHPDLLAPREPREALVPLALLAMVAALDLPDLPVLLERKAGMVVLAQLEKPVPVVPLEAREMPEPPVAREMLALLVPLETAVLPAKLAALVQLADPVQLAPLAVPAREEEPDHLVQLEARAQMPNTAHAHTAPPLPKHQVRPWIDSDRDFNDIHPIVVSCFFRLFVLLVVVSFSASDNAI